MPSPDFFITRAQSFIVTQQYNEAGVILAECLDEYPDNPEACAMLGSIFVKAGRAREAVAMLSTAIECRPFDVKLFKTYLGHLVTTGLVTLALSEVESARRAANDKTLDSIADQIKDHASSRTGSGQPSPHTSRNPAFNAAWTRLNKNVRSHNNWLNLAKISFKQRNLVSAEIFARRAIAIDNTNQQSWDLISQVLFDQERWVSSARAAGTANQLRDSPTQFTHRLCDTLVDRGLYAAALDVLRHLPRDPSRLTRDLLLLRAKLYDSTKDFPNAEADFCAVKAMSNLTDEEIFAIASYYQGFVDPEPLADLVATHCSPQRSKNSPTLQVAMGMSLARSSRFEDALDKFEAAMEGDLGDTRKATCLYGAASASDRMGAYRKAIRFADEANQITYSLNSHRFDPMRIASLCDTIKGACRDLTSHTATTHIPNLVFAVGFPRSGTTLLDTALRGHKKVVVLEERSVFSKTLSAVANDLKIRQPLTQSDIVFLVKNNSEQIHTKYLYNFHECLQSTMDNNTIYVDKMPLDLMYAPLINKIFSNQKFILSIRNPFDVAISNYFQNFRPTNFMTMMTSLEEIDRFYGWCFDNWFEFSHKFDTIPLTYKYEELVDGFEQKMKDICQYIEVEWYSNILEFNNTAKNRKRIYTPSVTQVGKPIYKSSTSRWKNYEFLFADRKLNNLERYAQKFGYI